nr:hypothetical protein BaRGS_032525 [Batillaria attramentaria]
MFITGTPPDLTLTVRLDNVRKEEDGQWRLELTNDVGTGYVDFNLHVNGVGSAESDVVDREVPADPPMEAPREGADEDEEGNSASNVETNFYWEIPDEPPPSPALPDNYLHPSMSTAVKDGSEDTRKMTPFYENSVLRSVRAAPSDALLIKSFAILLKGIGQVTEVDRKTKTKCKKDCRDCQDCQDDKSSGIRLF